MNTPKPLTLTPTPENIDRGARLLRSGGLVGMPTETVYGLAGDVFNTKSLIQIFELKKRPKFDPLIVHVAQHVDHSESPHVDPLEFLRKLDLVDLDAIDSAWIHPIQSLLRAFWPGPLTIILPKSRAVPDLATSGLDTVAIRMPRHPIARKLILASQTALAAPSANSFGRISPTQPLDVEKELRGIPLILDGDTCEIGIESTIIRFTSPSDVSILRLGAISSEEIQERTRLSVHLANHSKEPDEANRPISPGRLNSHYAPSKALYLLPNPIETLSDSERSLLREKIAKRLNQRSVGLLLQKGQRGHGRQFLKQIGVSTGTLEKSTVAVLSPSGDTGEIARNLFGSIRELDETSHEVLIAEPCHSRSGISLAIQDRLTRASQDWLN